MITNRPAIDWLTLTTYDAKVQRDMAMMISKLRPKWRDNSIDSKVKQYEGWRGEGYFVGAGRQKEKDHFMFRFSGDLSDAVTWQSPRLPIDCTRLDCQLTLPLPTPIEQTYKAYVSLVDSVDKSEKARGQRERNVDAIVSPDGFCSLYVGSRESERFYRLYVKESGGEYFLRFEVEYKGKESMAGRIWRDTAREPERLVIWLKGEIDTLPDHQLTTIFKDALSGVPGEIMKQGRERADPQKTLEWLKRQVSPAIKRLIGNEDTRDAAIILLMDWLKFAADQGEITL